MKTIISTALAMIATFITVIAAQFWFLHLTNEDPTKTKCQVMYPTTTMCDDSQCNYEEVYTEGFKEGINSIN